MEIFKIKTSSSENLKSLIIELNTSLQSLLEFFHLDKRWEEKDFYELELKKCFVRGVLRYTSVTQKVISEITKILSKKINIEKFKWITLPYPMIHMPKDYSEGSEYLHFDQGDKHDMYTCWLPVTKNQYSELSIFIFENTFINFFKKIISKFKIFNLFSINLTSKIGNIYLWSGHKLHKGNLNTSINTSCAIQMKITKEKYKTESSFLIKDFIKHDFKSPGQNNFDFKEKYLFYKKILNQLNEIKTNQYKDTQELFKLVLNIISEHTNYKHPQISFALSVLSQRIRQKNSKQWKKCLYYDIASLFLGSENLISLDRVKNDCSKKLNFSIKETDFQKIDILENY